jgi:hypothetical protein
LKEDANTKFKRNGIVQLITEQKPSGGIGSMMSKCAPFGNVFQIGEFGSEFIESCIRSKFCQDSKEKCESQPAMFELRIGSWLNQLSSNTQVTRSLMMMNAA